MSADPYHSDEYPEPTRGMSTTAKVLIGCGVVAGLCFVVCCGVGGFFMYQFAPRATDNAADVRSITQKIADITIPPQFAPESAVEFDNFLYTLRMVQYRDADGRGFLALMQSAIHFQGGQMSEAQMRAQFERQIQGEKRLREKETETREFEINGEQVPFQFSIAEDPSSNTMYRQVRGGFQGRSGHVELILQVEESVWDEDAVVKMLESIE